MATQHVGGSFAPPLTDELLTRYAELAAQAEPQVADAMHTLLKCCRAWWELPESTGAGRPHLSGLGTIIDLDADIATSLWDLIPWDYEIETMRARIGKIQQAESEENTRRLSAWLSAVAEAIKPTYVTEVDITSPVVTMLARMLRSLDAAIGEGYAAPEGIGDKLFGLFLPGRTKADIDMGVAQWKTWQAAIAAIKSGKSPSPIPRPLLLATAERDAAEHLLWHVIELDKDREPITADKV